MRRDGIRNIAIVAHVDHGKTTLVDSMLRQANVSLHPLLTCCSFFFLRVLDDQYADCDVGWMCSCYEVDSVEGPMPQTRFLLKKALEFGHAVVVVVNKLDRPSTRPDYVINWTFELFIELNASDEQKEKLVFLLIDWPMTLFETIIRCIPGPRIDRDGALQMLVSLNIEFEEHKGRIAIGRLHAGFLKKGMDVKVCTSEESCRYARISELFVYEKFRRSSVETVEAGDICAVCGINDIQIGETIADKTSERHCLPLSRNLRDRLYGELQRNLAMKVEDGESADTCIVSGRGTLHITILIENMRRGGYEFMVGPSRVISKRVNDELLEPYETAMVDVPEEHMGAVVELLGRRCGQMFDMQGVGSEGTTLLRYKIPTRGLLGLRNAMLTASRGTAILHTIFYSYGPWTGDISTRDQGSLVAFEEGTSTSYALSSSQERGQMFIGPGVDAYKGQIVGIHQRPRDLSLNVCKEKAATNVCSNNEQTSELFRTRH
ncbi:hypothetical protein MLD38_007563 [Melastoma candidum]|uniref:Uncharacterized protein n=1 Tax=Melastoma candidum TaxID=119954 RepID=A0ACB9RR04_9MYRT|nr:hypothetical protein MLD38_007563 [Melastoma candidum]